MSGRRTGNSISRTQRGPISRKFHQAKAVKSPGPAKITKLPGRARTIPAEAALRTLRGHSGPSLGDSRDTVGHPSAGKTAPLARHETGNRTTRGGNVRPSPHASGRAVSRLAAARPLGMTNESRSQNSGMQAQLLRAADQDLKRGQILTHFWLMLCESKRGRAEMKIHIGGWRAFSETLIW